MLGLEPMYWVGLRLVRLVCVQLCLGCVAFYKFGLDYVELVSFGICGSWFRLGLFRLCFVVLNQCGSTWIDLNSLVFISLGLGFVKLCGIV